MIYMRPLSIRDVWFCYRLASDPVARLYSHDPSLPTIHKHVKRFLKNRRDPSKREWVILRDGRKVGAVCLARDWFLAYETAISVSLTEDARGTGIGSAVIAWAARWAGKEWKADTIAEIRPENTASLLAFTKAGFTELNRTTERVRMIRPHNAVRAA